MIILGLCCISTVLQSKKPSVKCRVIQRKYYTVEKAVETAKENLEDVLRLLRYAVENKIYSVRLPSEILPRYTDRTVEKYSMEQFQPWFSRIGRFAALNQIRLSFHPDQFVVLSSDDPVIIDNSFAELEYQCEMLYRMGVPQELGVCNIHGGGVYGLDKDIVKRRWVDNYKCLPMVVKMYLTLENDERSYSLEDCLDISKMCGVPIVYDTFHEECYRASVKHTEEFKQLEELVDKVIETWNVKTNDFNAKRLPMAHISNQRKDERIGAHSDYISVFPEILWYYSSKCETLHLDVEAKMKDLAILELRRKYPELL